MLRINYEFTATQPIFSGSDENFGTERKLRREKITLKEPLIVKSNYKNITERRKDILTILHNVWKNLDTASMPSGRLMGIYDEFSSKLIASTGVKTKLQFLNELCYKFGIRSLNNEEIIDILNKFNDAEFLQTIREEHQYLVLLLRRMVKDKEKRSRDLFSKDELDSVEELYFQKSFETPPYISGNGIRGYLRRVVMHDFCKRVGITKLNKTRYHQLFTGGTLSESNGTENIDQRELEIKSCPMIGLFGSAIGNMTIQGEMKIAGARPLCLEYSTGNLSYWELLGKTFQIRLDSSKTEKEIEIESSGNEPTSQMKYEFEVFNVGTKFNHQFILTTEDELLKSAFYHALQLFTENNFIGGNSARDSGEIDLTKLKALIPEDSNKTYLEYLENNKEEIVKYFK